MRRRRNRELDEEIEAHLRLAVADRIARGETREQAEAAARRELGNVGLVKEITREQWGWTAVEQTIQDARHAVRALAKSPGFAFVAIAALALGIGANTAILSVVDAILMKPLPYAGAERLVVLLHHGRNPVAPANFVDWRRQSRSFEAMGAAEYWTPNLTAAENPEKLWALRMTADVLPMLGVAPLTGRFFGADEEISGKDHVAVIGHGLWRRRFGSDPHAVGSTIALNGEPYTIIGVMPPGFRFAPFWATNAELWAPLAFGDRAGSRESSSLRVFARLKPGVSLAQARAEMAAITGRLEREFPGTNQDVAVLPLKEKVVGEIRPALLVLLAAVGLVLLVACANVAHMLLARAAARQREIAVRAALGASRARLVRQTLTESLVLSLAGAAAGVALAAYGLRILVWLAPASIPRVDGIVLDGRVLLATLAVSLLTAIGFGLAPALHASAVRVQDALQEGGRGAAESRRRSRLRRLFVASEVALALVLLVGAGLMMRSFAALQRIDPGWDPRNVLTMVVSVGGTKQAEPDRRAVFYGELLARVRAVPGVRAAGLINHLPIAGDIWGLPYAVGGRPRPLRGESPVAAYRVVFPGYFRAMRIPLLRGRDVAESDGPSAAEVVVVNEYLANRQWPGEDPIGRRISLEDKDGQPVWATVVGVARNSVREDWSAEPDDEVYMPWLQNTFYRTSPGPQVAYMTLVARTDGDAAAMAASLRAAVWSVDPGLPISEVQTMERVVMEATAGPRFQMLLLGLFAAVAVILAAVGIYGVMSYAVSRRTREIGVRMALGANAPDVLRLVIGEAMAVALGGAAAGLAGALLLTQLMRGLLYGVGPSDPVTYAAVAALLLGIALLASYLPARRAARIDPIEALRQE